MMHAITREWRSNSAEKKEKQNTGHKLEVQNEDL